MTDLTFFSDDVIEVASFKSKEKIILHFHTTFYNSTLNFIDIVFSNLKYSTRYLDIHSILILLSYMRVGLNVYHQVCDCVYDNDVGECLCGNVAK